MVLYNFTTISKSFTFQVAHCWINLIPINAQPPWVLNTYPSSFIPTSFGPFILHPNVASVCSNRFLEATNLQINNTQFNNHSGTRFNSSPWTTLKSAGDWPAQRAGEEACCTDVIGGQLVTCDLDHAARVHGVTAAVAAMHHCTDTQRESRIRRLWKCR